MNSILASYVSESETSLRFNRVTFAICPTGAYCREDRCQSYFSFELIPSMRAPMEECEAAGAVRAAGGVAAIIDAPAARLTDHAFMSALRRSAPEVVVVVVTFGTLEADLAWVERIRIELPGIPIGVRGAPCYTSEREIFAHPSCVDFSIKGEYESIFFSLVKNGIASTPGISYRTANSVVFSDVGPRVQNLDTLPFPDRSSLDLHLYQVRGFGGAQATVRVQRGCPFPCTYCLVHLVSGKNARHRSASHIVDEVEQLTKEGISSFYFRADTFTLKRDWVIELCHELTRRCPTIRWVTTTRVDQVDDALITEMAKAGCYGISFGVDVASSTIGEKVQKTADVKKTEAALAACDRAGIISLVYCMIGFVWETQETLAETRKFLKTIRPDLLTIHFAHPYPGTRYFTQASAEGIKVTSSKAQAEPAADTSSISSEQLRLVARSMLREHYIRPSVALSLTRKMVRYVARRAVCKVPKWSMFPLRHRNTLSHSIRSRSRKAHP